MWRLHIELFYIKGPLLQPPLQNTILTRTKQQAPAVPPCNNEPGNCLLKPVTLCILGFTPNHDITRFYVWSSLSVIYWAAVYSIQTYRWQDLIISWTGTLVWVLLSVYVHDIIPQGAAERGETLVALTNGTSHEKIWNILHWSWMHISTVSPIKLFVHCWWQDFILLKHGAQV